MYYTYNFYHKFKPVTDMLASVLDYGAADEENDAEERAHVSHVVQERGGLLKKKVIAVTKLLRVYKTLR